MRSLLILLAACRCTEPAVPPVEQASVEVAVTLSDSMQRGVCVAHSWEDSGERGYGTGTSAATLREVRALGASWVSLTPFGFMSSLHSDEVSHVGERRGGETDERVRREIRAARECGLQVLLKPHIWVGGGEWRAELAPEDWAEWFRSYRTWILQYARMAEEEGASIFAVGTELRSTTQHEAEWRALVVAVRAAFHGQLVYCANWDAVDAVSFWDAFDYIGVQFYPPLAETETASERTMSANLDAYLERLALTSSSQDRPVLLAEVGYKSTRDTALRPYEWTERGASAVDAEAQARAYRVFFRGVAQREWIEGVYLWKWFTNPETQEEGPRGFSPRGKPAEAVIREAFSTSHVI